LSSDGGKAMSFLKRLLGLGEGGEGRPRDAKGLYYYVRCDRCGEVIQVRLDRNNDLSILDYQPMTFFARKVIIGTRCFNRMEAEFTYDRDRKLIEKKVSGGQFVEYEDYLTYQKGQQEEEAPEE
jgi:hypothetical protein